MKSEELNSNKAASMKTITLPNIFRKNKVRCVVTGIILTAGIPLSAQTVIQLPYSGERETDNKPSITVYLPEKEKANGLAVILCPGGGLRVLSWHDDVERMASMLNSKGIAAIGLKYTLDKRTHNSGGGPMPKMVDVTQFAKFKMANANPMPSEESTAICLRAAEDARNAIRTVRDHADKWNINPDKVGYLGFSAGGGVAIAATVTAKEGEMPDFLASAFGPSLIDVTVPEQAPPLLIMTRTEHPNVAAGCLQLFLEWKKAGKNAEMHFYGDGQGPFTLMEHTGKTTTENWSDEFLSWLKSRF